MLAVKVRAIGTSAGVVLPKEVLSRLRCKKGDELYIVETKNGIELTPYEPEFAKDIKLAEDIIDRNKNLLEKLAK